MSTGPDAILIVDDNPDDVEFTRRAFTRNAFTNPIVVAHDGVEALDLLLPDAGRVPLRPSIVLLDINMPRLSGLDVLRRLRAAAGTQTVPVVMLSTSNEARDIAESYLSGANSYVCKPSRFDEFVRTTQVLGTYWLSVNERVPG